jgi:stearoyl-CoA desaturase (delta-9 desaturase)
VDDRINPAGIWPFALVHLMCLGVFFVGWSWVAVGVCAFNYFIRMFGITGGYHRYFSHRSYKTSRPFQFLLAWLACSSAQKGPLWWAAHHRHHHRYSDTEKDEHSPHTHSLFFSHVGWIFAPRNKMTDYKAVRDFGIYPELVLLDRYHLVAPWVLGFAMFGLGWLLEALAPGLGTTRWQMLIWGFFVSTVLLYHGTFSINSLAHLYGNRRFETGEHSRNNFWLALITLGEGWHNNHHFFPASERQGFYWWEIDVSHYILKGLEKLGLVRELREPPRHLLEKAPRARSNQPQARRAVS